MLGLDGWFSTNILGNRDGEVLEEPSSFRTKEESKLSVLDVILRQDLHPELYGDYVHRVSIHYYPPRGDNKEGWDNIDLFGWLGYPMPVSYTHLRAHETPEHLVCRLLLEKKKNKNEN